MRVLAIDFGSKRMGIAVSDELGIIASPLEVIPAEPSTQFLARLREILEQKQVKRIIVGMPRQLDGSYGPAAVAVREFVSKLKESVSIPIECWDERLTSAQANRALIEAGVRRKDRRGRVDKTAAAILLQSYLDHAQNRQD